MKTVPKNPTVAFNAIENQIKTICLSEFPCGLGSWREHEPLLKSTERTLKRSKKEIPPISILDVEPESFEGIKILAQKEKSESLQELVASHFSPWHLDYSWSDEAKELREIAVRSPWLIDKNFVLNHFKTLRIANKDVTEIDPKILKLKNLEELTLSANYITNINSKNLPSSLKVLELCANQIHDISGLCVRPPSLEHLGLGRNKVSFLGDYITGDFWPRLLSLDLSHNDLCDLMDVIRKLLTLPKLRNLILQGNPLSLIPGYRGYTIDSLPRLSIMDDIHISADERHHFKGLARRREFILDEAQIQLGITYMKGLPCPEEVKNPNDQPQFPIVERTYYIEFLFLEERGEISEEIAPDELVDILGMENESGEVEQTEQEESEEQSVLQTSSGVAKLSEPKDHIERNVLFNARPQLKSADLLSTTKGSVVSFPRPHLNPDPEVVPGPSVDCVNLNLTDYGVNVTEEAEEVEPCPAHGTSLPQGVRVTPIKSDPLKWAEEQELNWTIDLVRDDLHALGDFFKQGMDFNVIEQVVLGYPLENDDSSASDKKKSETSLKQAKEVAGKDKKKKKESETELIRSTPSRTVMASFHITLDSFLDGEFEYTNVFSKADVPPPSTIRSMDSEDKNLEKKDSKDGKRSSERKSEIPRESRKSPRPKESKELDKKFSIKAKKSAEEAEEEELPLPPLELEVTIKLHHWLTALDSVKDEEKKNKENENDASNRTVQTNKSKEK